MSSSSFKPAHPDEFHSSGWDSEAKRPIVNGKFEDPKTGELRAATGTQFAGPPAIDIVIMNLHQDTTQNIYRAQRPFPLEKLLSHFMRVVQDRKLQIDSLNATPYAIRIILAHELKQNEFTEVVDLMANGIWNQA